MPVGLVHRAGNLMAKNVNKLQLFEACLHFLASKFPLTQTDMHYKSNQVALILNIIISTVSEGRSGE